MNGNDSLVHREFALLKSRFKTDPVRLALAELA